MLIQYERIYDYQHHDDDGYVVYIDKMYPRGIKKTNPWIKRWIKGLAPSYDLIEWYHVDEKTRWDGFKKKYTQELRESYKNDPAFKEKIDKLASHDRITLLYSLHDVRHNNARVLAKFLYNLKMKNKKKS